MSEIKRDVLSPSITSIKKQMALPPGRCLLPTVSHFQSSCVCTYLVALMCVSLLACVCVCVCVCVRGSSSASPDRTFGPTAEWEKMSAEGSEDRGRMTGERGGETCGSFVIQFLLSVVKRCVNITTWNLCIQKFVCDRSFRTFRNNTCKTFSNWLMSRVSIHVFRGTFWISH